MKKQTRSPQAFEKMARAPQNAAATDIVELILNDHTPLKLLIETLKNIEIERPEKAEPLEEFVFLLRGHAKAEEKSLYAAMKSFAPLKIQSFEGDTEHAIAEQLIHEINATSSDEAWLAKVKVLAESVENHIEEEETLTLKKVQSEMTKELRMKIGNEYTQNYDEYIKLSTIRPTHNPRFNKSGSQIYSRISP